MLTATYLGHSAVQLEAAGKTLLIDPFLTGNPRASATRDEIRADAIFVSHGHDDHLGDTVPIARRCGSIVVACYELATYLQRRGCTNAAPMHIGGKRDFHWFTIRLTPSAHGSGKMDDPPIYTGPAVGALIEMGGFTVYHPGDTGLTIEMELIGRLRTIDLAFLPIGGNFTMDIDDAVEAVKMLGPKRVVPIHYNTIPQLACDPATFVAKVGSLAEVTLLEPGQALVLD